MVFWKVLAWSEDSNMFLNLENMDCFELIVNNIIPHTLLWTPSITCTVVTKFSEASYNERQIIASMVKILCLFLLIHHNWSLNCRIWSFVSWQIYCYQYNALIIYLLVLNLLCWNLDYIRKWECRGIIVMVFYYF